MLFLRAFRRRVVKLFNVEARAVVRDLKADLVDFLPDHDGYMPCSALFFQAVDDAVLHHGLEKELGDHDVEELVALHGYGIVEPVFKARLLQVEIKANVFQLFAHMYAVAPFEHHGVGDQPLKVPNGDAQRIKSVFLRKCCLLYTSRCV